MWMLTNANGYTFDDRRSRFSGCVIDGDRIVAVGQTEALRLQFGSRVDGVLDVDGATVIPGLVDSHLHIVGVGEQAVRLSLRGVRSKHELLARVRAYAQARPPDEWIVGAGWDEHQFDEPGLPSLDELDAAAGGRPLLLRRVCSHACLTSTRAFLAGGVHEGTPDPADGRFGRDLQGRLTGVVYEAAMEPILRALPEPTSAEARQTLRLGLETALAAGLTAVHTDDTRYLGGFAATWASYRHLLDSEAMRIRVHELVDWAFIDECLAGIEDGGVTNDAWLTLGAAKLFSDGAFGSRTAWLAQPYADQPGWLGTPMYTADELMRRVRFAHERGFPVAVHAIGDAALDTTLQALEAAPTIAPLPVRVGPVRARRDRVVHAALIRADLVARLAALTERVAVDIQPRFVVSDFPWVAQRVGATRAAQICAWQTLATAGIRVCGGSDAPVEPISPLLGIHAAVTRRRPDVDGPGMYMEQAVTPEQAVQWFTRDACLASGDDGDKGVVAPGWLADFTVIDRDVVHPGHPDDIRDARVLHTLVGGQLAYAADGRDASWMA